MLSSLLLAIEQAFGPSISSTSHVVYIAGLAVLAYVIVAPLVRVVVDYQSAAIGMERRWIMHCLSCRRVTVVSGAKCEHCGADLGVPWTVRLRQLFSPGGDSGRLRALRWIYTVSGVIAFAVVTAIGFGSFDAWDPQTNIEKLFVGLSILTWAGLGWLLGRVVGIGTGGPITRLRDAVFSLALSAVLVLVVTLASAARPVQETVVAQVRVDGQVAQMGDKAIALVGYQLGFEYLLIEHEFAGFRSITPLAIIGARRLDLPIHERRAKVIELLWANADALGARGLSVRKRTDQFMVSRSGMYEIVIRGGDIVLRPYASPS